MTGPKITSATEPMPTPTPWTFVDFSTKASNRPIWAALSGDKQICSSSWHHDSAHFPTKPEALANAALIVRCVNAHAGLVKALIEAERFMAYFANETDGHFSGDGTPTTCLVEIRAALASAGVKS